MFYEKIIAKMEQFQNFKILQITQKLSKLFPISCVLVLLTPTTCGNLKSFGALVDIASFSRKN